MMLSSRSMRLAMESMSRNLAAYARCVVCTRIVRNRLPVLVEVALVASHVSYGHCRVLCDIVVGGICISKSHADIWSFVHGPRHGLDLT